MFAERAAVNYKIQGSGADGMKMILVRTKKEFVDPGFGFVLANIHDEELGESNKKKISNEKTEKLIVKIMTTTFSLKNVPVEADFKFINNWREGK